MIKIRCVVERITYQSPETGYSVLKCAVKNYNDLVTVVGNLVDVNVGSVLLIDGNWKVDAKYGRQFQAESWEETMSATVFGIEKYLGFGLIKGVGPKFAKKIVQQFGTDTLEIIETDVQRLLEVPGIGKKRIDKIAESWERQMTYSNKTISNHIDYLADAFLISKASRYDIKGRKYIGANLKYYFTDLGLRNARLNFRQQEPTHIMENIVYNELLIRGYNVDVGIVEIFDKDKEGKRVRKQLEVDFVVNQGNQRYYIQVAYDMTSEEKQTQEFNSLRKIPDSFKKIVIVNGSKKPWRNDEGFVIMGMKYFLLNADSLEY